MLVHVFFFFFLPKVSKNLWRMFCRLQHAPSRPARRWGRWRSGAESPANQKVPWLSDPYAGAVDLSLVPNSIRVRVRARAARYRRQSHMLVQSVPECVSSSWMMQTLMLLIHLPVPEAWIQSSTSGTSCIAASTLTRLTADDWCLNPGLGGHSPGDLAVWSRAHPNLLPSYRYVKASLPISLSHTHTQTTLTHYESDQPLLSFFYLDLEADSETSHWCPLIDLTLLCVKSGMFRCFCRATVYAIQAGLNVFANRSGNLWKI